MYRLTVNTKNILWISALLLQIVLFTPATTQADTTQVYAMQHQLAESLLPVVRNNLQSNETANAYNNKIIVQASEASQQKIAQLLQQLDTPLRNLRITVHNNSTTQSQGNSVGVGGGIRTGKVYLGANGPIYQDNSSGNNIIVESNGVRIQSSNNTRRETNQQEQQLRVIEGTPAWISTGQDIPYNTDNGWGNRTTTYHNADRGFYVTAHILGNRVQLTISTSNDQLSDNPYERQQGIVNTQHLQTTVSGAVGEWINLGGITLDNNTNDSRYGGSGDRSSFTIGDVAVSVVPLD